MTQSKKIDVSRAKNEVLFFSRNAIYDEVLLFNSLAKQIIVFNWVLDICFLLLLLFSIKTITVLRNRSYKRTVG